MTIFDIIVCIIAAIAVINGWRHGFAVQAFGLFAIIVGLFVASRTGAEAGAKMGLDPSYATAVGFLVIFLCVAGVILLVGRLVKGVFRFAGLGILDVLFGMMLSLLKVAIVLGIVCLIFDKINDGAHFVSQSSLDRSITYRPLCRSIEMLGVLGREAGTGTEKIVEKTLENL